MEQPVKNKAITAINKGKLLKKLAYIHPIFSQHNTFHDSLFIPRKSRQEDSLLSPALTFHYNG